MSDTIAGRELDTRRGTCSNWRQPCYVYNAPTMEASRSGGSCNRFSMRTIFRMNFRFHLQAPWNRTAIDRKSVSADNWFLQADLLYHDSNQCTISCRRRPCHLSNVQKSSTRPSSGSIDIIHWSACNCRRCSVTTTLPSAPLLHLRGIIKMLHRETSSGLQTCTPVLHKNDNR